MTRVVVNVLRCDGRHCEAQVSAPGRAARVRREAADRGWSRYRGGDFCPHHDPTRGVVTVESPLLNGVEP